MDKELLLSIERPHKICAECGAPLEELSHNPTRLTIKSDESQRADYCPDCWEFQKNEAYDSYWQTRRLKVEKRMPKLSRREKAMAARALFESLWDRRDEGEVEPQLFFISHLLMKWGGLKFLRTETLPDGREAVTFENPVTGDPIEIRSSPMSEEAMQEIKDRVEAFLRDYAPENEVAL